MVKKKQSKPAKPAKPATKSRVQKSTETVVPTPRRRATVALNGQAQ